MADFPRYPEDLVPEFLTELIGVHRPGTRAKAVHIDRAHGFGDTHVSTSARVFAQIEFDANPCDLPTAVMVKMAKTDEWPARRVALPAGGRQRTPRTALYENEVSFYRLLGDDGSVSSPDVLGAGFDEESGRFALVLEDISCRAAQFPSQYDAIDRSRAESLVDSLARLHAAFWDTPRFEQDMAWLQRPFEGRVSDCIRGPVRASVVNETERFKFKREMLERIGTDPQKLFTDLDLLQRHQAQLPSTLIHGDAHFGNCYLLPDGSVGLYDWQLAARGFCMHDVAYMIVTALSIAQRRDWERDLIAFYRDRLLEYGVAEVPSRDLLFTEYRRAMQWCVTIGWMPCPPEAYGWELVVIANNRTVAAYEDLDTARAIAELN